MQDIIGYTSLFHMHFTIITLYYLFSTVFYFLMWFFKRKISVFIEENYLQLKLQLCYWFGFGFTYLYYGMLYTESYQRNTWIIFACQVIACIVYVGMLLYPVLTKLRSKIPDMRH